MTFKELDIKRSYISCGTENIADSFLVPALKCTKIYRRSVGFFSSGVFEPIINGVMALVRNKGLIQLITSPRLNEEDIEAISLGYEKREQIVKACLNKRFIEEVKQFDDLKLQLLIDLISRGILDIKVAVTDSLEEYHDKLGILEDFNGNVIAFYGVANSSFNGYKNNYEKIRIVKGWVPGEQESVLKEQQEFLNLWNGMNPFVAVYEYKESAQKNLLTVIKNRQKQAAVLNQPPIKLRDYQQQAIAAWLNNNYHGFYVMATGTGKTWTAIYSAKELLKKHRALVVICAPYKHLVRQWAEDVEKAFPSAKLILVSSENLGWEQQIRQENIRKKYEPDNQVIIISTIASFKMKRFMTAIGTSSDEKLLIVDEAHRFTERPEELKEIFHFMLGLSATPFNGSSAPKGKALMDYFGGQVFSLTIEEALKRGYLVSYNYYPIYVYATLEEEQRFISYTQKIISCFKNNRCVNPDLLVKSLRNRLRVIAMAEEKQEHINEIIAEIKETDHFVVYCGDGRTFDLSSGEEIRHIQAVKRVLTNRGFKSSQFTAKESMSERMQLVDAFNKGEISALAALRCLDEGINIPSIKSALILASNDEYREFVQRRGRILRTYAGKENADIYDVVVLPSHNLSSWAKIEFRRFFEYARLALNWEDLQNELDSYLTQYGLNMDDINVYEYEDMEEVSYE